MGVTHILTYLFVSIKVGYISKNKYVYSRYNNFCLKLLNLLYTEGFIEGYLVDKILKRVKIKLKYYNNKPVISKMDLLSLPSFKNYVGFLKLKKTFKNYDYFCVFTSNGLISSRNYLFQTQIKFGGQLLFGFKLNIN